MGGFAEYGYILPITKSLKYPGELSDEECVGVSCALRTVVAAFERLGGIGIGDTVVIQGSGPIGLYSLPWRGRAAPAKSSSSARRKTGFRSPENGARTR
jgi:NADPH:quinone reductase-like Zn-dependent oxidoreductase